ncbi:uncharacterized protein PHACADRAFT_263704 [Phanerochaete carnosa HHB-10118-sp]|uniref:assimilatory sulfite reductase (NADPH) n=1 Tax=Phanerochaete carnosa (strain HHB-10118-sp) TaxID=650164 RepID=K5ULA0_PHACS|nr:uncharacterized protein PHACADRAFT_263704 [Phanerochaete carnosa HHB-10118-sp]EKM50421.1 hypothetical protein PHACADRAFT_263704 [Phanerochaete carnosa HHB-10118-sp]
MVVTSSAAAVSRIAYLASDVLVDSRPPLPAASKFLDVLNTLSEQRGAKPVYSLPSGADPSGTLLRNSSTSLVAYTASSKPELLHHLLVHLSELSTAPVVFHIAIEDDLSDVLILRSSVPFFLFSRTAQQAHDNALLGSRLARLERKPVLHVFADVEGFVEEIESDWIPPFLSEDSAAVVNGHVLPSDEYVPALYQSYLSAATTTSTRLRRSVRAFSEHGSGRPHTVIFTFGRPLFRFDLDDILFVDISLVNPLPASQINSRIPPGVSRVLVVEQVRRWSTKWTPLYLEVVNAIQQDERDEYPTVHSVSLEGDVHAADILKLVRHASEESPSKRLQLGYPSSPMKTVPLITPHVPKHESSYVKILNQLFGERLQIANSPGLVASQGQVATTPEFALGRVRGEIELRNELVEAIKELLQDSAVTPELHSLLSKWLLNKDDPSMASQLGQETVEALEAGTTTSSAANRVLSLKAHFPVLSRWIVGSDAWSYDVGASGLHHAIASKLNLNILLLDTVPYSSRNVTDPNRRKHDVGLYAMNHGDVYVASVAVYSSYAQVLHALVEADRYEGPSVVLAYLPYKTEEDPALSLLKETKLAVDAGYWPLYRWNPSKEAQGKEPFTLDSDAVKNDLQQFLDRQNHLSQLVRSKPQLAAEIVSSLGENVKEARRKRAQQSYAELLTAIDAPPLLVLYASDGGKTEKVARRLATRGKMRGLSTTVQTMDSITVEDLAKEEYVAFLTSVAGQGEFPQNGRTLFKALNALASRGEKPLTNLKFTVFGMGDSHYWPRLEDAHYYNKAGKDLDRRLEQLGGQRVAEFGFGDDQDADGPETGYKLWEPLVWKTLGVDAIEVREAEPEPITNEHIKVASQYLRGTIVEGLQDNSTGALAPSDTQLTKFHGIYQQDDRDIRDERQAQGVEPAYAFMIRVRMPGGVCTPEQWLAMDQIADEHGTGSLKITTRQTFQFHGVIKRHLKMAIQDINRVLLDTLAACGDVNRNVICSSIPSISTIHKQTYEFAKRVSSHLVPRTTAYHEIWLDKKLVAGDALKDVEPLYGEFYLPRKFKIAVAVPPQNDVDVFANDVGFIAIVDEKGELSGFNVTAGGGMGVTHGNKKTYPRTGSLLGFCTVEQGHDVAEKIMLVQRDNGNRADRKNARLKYTIDRMGLETFKAEVEKRLGYKLQPVRHFSFDRNIDDFGWIRGDDGKHHFSCFIENGRVQDEPERDFKTALREIAKVHRGTFRLTTNQHLVISDIADEDVPQIKELLAKYNLDYLNFSGLRLSSSACVAFPTCGLAMAESERYLPILIDKVEKICEENGLRNDSIVMRMTGCPNGCARPYLAEVAFVGKAPGSYMMLLGGGYYGQRMNKIYRDAVTESEILAILKPMIKQYALERLEGEHFGDFVIRVGYIAPTESGMTWWDGAGGEGVHREAVV